MIKCPHVIAEVYVTKFYSIIFGRHIFGKEYKQTQNFSYVETLLIFLMKFLQFRSKFKSESTINK